MFEGAFMRLHRNLRHWSSPPIIKKRSRTERRILLHLEELETRALLSASGLTAAEPASVAATNQIVRPLLAVDPQQASPQQSSAISGYTPQQIQQIYGYSQLPSSINGAGETIAIVDAYYDPNIVSDANTFNAQFNLPTFNTAGGPTLNVVATGGGSPSSLPQDSTGAWPLETSLDVEWAHAMAPQANILLVEAPTQNLSGPGSLLDAVQYAASQPGVVVVSMSWGQNEFSGETSYDSYFQPYSISNPNGYSNPAGVTFVAAAGDNGAYSGPLYPATSPYVLAVGGTTLGGSTSSTGGTSGGFYGTGSSFGSSAYGLTASARSGGGLYSGAGSLSVTPTTTTGGGSTTTYPGESAWSGGGGGVSAYEGEPSYQYNQTSIDQTFGSPNVETYNYATGTYSYYYSRMTPDVAYNANPSTGYAIYDSIPSPSYGIQGGWTEVGGTSAGAPQWSAIVALSDQERSSSGSGSTTSLDTNQVQNTLYNTLSNSTTYASVFHDITTGSNGYSAGVGYDLATGLGSPIVNNLVPLLAKTTIPLGQLPTIRGSGDGGSGASSAGFSGSSGFSSGSYYGLSATSQTGGGLYAGAGSITVPTSSVAASVPNGASVPLPTNAVATSLVSVPTNNGAANSFVAFSASESLFNPSTNGNLVAGPANTAVTQSNAVFGASGVTGPPDSWRMSSLGLNGPQVEQLADELMGLVPEEGNNSPSGDDTGQQADDSAGDIFALDEATPVLLEADTGANGDGV